MNNKVKLKTNHSWKKCGSTTFKINGKIDDIYFVDDDNVLNSGGPVIKLDTKLSCCNCEKEETLTNEMKNLIRRFESENEKAAAVEFISQ